MLINFDPTANISDLIAYHGRTTPDAEALVFGRDRLNWADCDRDISRIANGLAALGLGRGDKVAILADTSVEYFITFFGILRAGCCAVPLSGMAAAESLALMIEDCDAKALFVSRKTKPLVEAISDNLGRIPAAARFGFDFSDDQWRQFHQWKDSRPSGAPPAAIAGADEFNIIYSSGTTGVPKGILHDHQTRSTFWRDRDKYRFGPNARTILSTPLYSNTTLFALLPTVAWGGTVILLPRSDTGHYLEVAQRERATHTMQVPVQYQRLHDFEGFGRYDLSSFVWKFSTSAPLRTDLKNWLVTDWPGAFTEIYGMTEGGVGCSLDAHLHPDKLHTVGQARDGGQIRIVDERMHDVPRGQVGEIIGRAANMMTGYYNKPEATAAGRWTDPEGNLWQRSGDLARMDDDGFIVLLDRIKDMIISGGFNVYASDLEAVLIQHPDVQDAGVIGIPSDAWGETPLGLVVPRPGAVVTEEEIREWVNSRLGKQQRLCAVEFRDELPRSTIGKLLKRELRAPYWQDRQQKVG